MSRSCHALVPHALATLVVTGLFAGCGNCGSPPISPPTATAHIRTGAPSGNTTEAGAQAGFSVVLESEPTADVTVQFDSNDTTEGTVATKSLTFTKANWNAPQTVMVTGVNDDEADGSQSYAIVFSATTSSDAAYAALTPDSVSLTNTDNDSAGITVNAPSGSTTEAGGQATFTVVLNSQPKADVIIHFDSNDTTEGTVATRSLTFTPLNWNAPRSVTVTGVNDDEADGPGSYAIVFSATTSSDAAYSALVPSLVDLTNTDDDSAGITVSALSSPTTESGGQATFTVVLDSQPFADVTVNFDSNDTTEGTVATKRLTFTSTNWKAPQTVTVTGVNDDLADGNQPYAIVFSATTSSDASYAAMTPASVNVTNTDNDSAGITVSTLSGSTTEAGGQATFTVVLDSQPFANVTVNLDSNDITEGTVSPKSLTFTDVNWNAPQTVTVTGVNDDLIDGNQPYAIVFSATTTDVAYATIKPANVGFTNTDDDSAGFSVSALSGPTTEAGGQAIFTVVLTSQPTANVTVDFGSNDTTEGTVSPNRLAFTDADWKAPQTVTVTGVDDDLADGNQPYAIVFSVTTSSDTAYAAITPANITLTNTDDDSAGIGVSAISGSTTEAGGLATFTVVLTSQPTANVTVNFDSNDTTEGTVATKSLTFTPANWKAPQTVSVTGIDDDLADGNQPYAIVFSATTSSDAAYAAITLANVNLTNTDNDSVGFTVSGISGPTNEFGGPATFTVRLNSQPFANVTVNVDSNDTTEGTVSPRSLTFTPSNWSTPQTATVTGQSDAVRDGNQPYAIVFLATTSSDAAYAAIRPGNISVINLDDDAQVFSFINTEGDDVADTALHDFFAGLSVTPSDFIFVEVTGTNGGAWCSVNAMWYADQYVLRAQFGGGIASDWWDKYTRTGPPGSKWYATNTPYSNIFGEHCSGTYSWCPEWYIAPPGSAYSLHFVIMPASKHNEVALDSTIRGESLTIRVASTRAMACGF